MTTLLPPPAVPESALTSALSVAESIASKDRSNLFLTSQFFTDPARYDAFIAMYAVMRVIDDLVDDVPDKARLSEAGRTVLLRSIDAWENRIRNAYSGAPFAEPLDVALSAAVRTFPVPIDFWRRFLDAMRFDVSNPRFADFREFVEYGEGATVAPTAMYVYLLTSERQPDGRYVVKDFDYAACGRDLGLFAYVAHVLRDVRTDLEVGDGGLVYLSLDDLARHDLSESDLFTLTSGSAPQAMLERWRSLVRDLCARARVMCSSGAGMARTTWVSIPEDCEFIFRLIIAMYAELLDRIEADPDRVLSGEPVLSAADREAILEATAAAAGFNLPGEITRPAARPGG